MTNNGWILHKNFKWKKNLKKKNVLSVHINEYFYPQIWINIFHKSARPVSRKGWFGFSAQPSVLVGSFTHTTIHTIAYAIYATFAPKSVAFTMDGCEIIMRKLRAPRRVYYCITCSFGLPAIRILYRSVSCLHFERKHVYPIESLTSIRKWAYVMIHGYCADRVCRHNSRKNSRNPNVNTDRQQLVFSEIDSGRARIFAPPGHEDETVF